MMSAEIEKEGRRRRRTEAEEAELDNEEEQSEGKGYTAKKGRATPGRRSASAQEESETGNVVTRTGGTLLDYIQGVRDELQKVTWPTREETLRLSRIVLIVLVLSAVILGGIAFGFNILFAQGIENPLYFVVFFAVVGAVVFFVRARYLNQTDETTTLSR